MRVQKIFMKLEYQHTYKFRSDNPNTLISLDDDVTEVTSNLEHFHLIMMVR